MPCGQGTSTMAMVVLTAEDEKGSCSGHETECLRNPNLVLEALNVHSDSLVFRSWHKAKAVFQCQ